MAQNAIINQHNIYNESVNFIFDPPHDLEIKQIIPDQKFKVSTTMIEKDILKEGYKLGCDAGNKFLNEFNK